MFERFRRSQTTDSDEGAVAVRERETPPEETRVQERPAAEDRAAEDRAPEHPAPERDMTSRPGPPTASAASSAGARRPARAPR